MARLVPDTINKCVKEGQSDLKDYQIHKQIGWFHNQSFQLFQFEKLPQGVSLLLFYLLHNDNHLISGEAV